MDDENIPRIGPDAAADLLISAVVRGAYLQSIRSIVRLLRSAKGTVAFGRRWKGLQAWYAQLEKDDQARVTQVVDEAVHAAIFSVLAIIDGEGENVLPHTVTELSIHLKVYASDDEVNKREPSTNVEIDPQVLFTSSGLLHDRFQQALHEARMRKRLRTIK